MGIDRKEIERIAKLAKLKLSEEEIVRYEKDINEILNYMDKLNELDTSNVRPLNYPIEKETSFREDKISPSVSREEALKNAPVNDGEFFKVPKVIKNK
jgi:aspartyl-tRNA(Asn)/glutamyl-tRNA(Gln) amidotransferase subunit C